MLSVCIPVYNYYITALVEEIHRQCLHENVAFEILVIDDASQENYKIHNRSIQLLDEVKYLELSENFGRSKIRNLLAQQARYEYLLFMDCDAKLPEFFVKKYLQKIEPDKIVVGGVSYEKQKPEKQYLLRWNYGIKRESTDAENRTKQAYNSFKTFNFLIPKKIFKEVQFDENLTGYGHEDTLFGIALKTQQIPLVHIDNPLIHLGLEQNKVFLEKTKTGIQNLAKLMRNANTPKEFNESVSLIRFYNKIPFWLKKILALKFKLFHHILEKILLTGKAPMRLFDFYKLAYLCAVV